MVELDLKMKRMTGLIGCLLLLAAYYPALLVAQSSNVISSSSTTVSPISGVNSKFKLSIETDISLDEPMVNQTVSVGGRLNLDCLITGSPLPQYRFYKHGELLDSNENDRYEFRLLTYGARLIVSPVEMGDAGLYKCQGWNFAGNSSSSAYVQVRRETQNPRTQSPDTGDHIVDPPSGGDQDVIGDPFCQEYRGTYCQYLKTKDIFVRSRADQDNAERVVITMIQVLIGAGLTYEHECLQRSVEAMCYSRMPLCVPSEPLVQPQRLCRKDCEDLYTICNNDIKEIPTWNALPDCANLDNLQGCIHINNLNSGVSISKLNSTTPVEPTKPDLLEILLPIILGTVVVVAIVVTIVCVCRNKHKNRLRTPLTSNSSGVKSQEMSVVSDRSGSSPVVKEIDINNINMLQELGTGIFGTIYRGQVFGLYGNNTASQVFIKSLKSPAATDEAIAFKEELNSMADIRHQNTLTMLAANTLSSPQCLMYENLPCGDLQQFLQSREEHRMHLNSRETMYIVTQVAAGLEYLASVNFVHKDIAAHNVIMGQNLNIKISTLKIIYGVHSASYCLLHNQQLPIRWCPPETITYGKFSKETDIYMFGVLLWEAFSHGRTPYIGYSNQEVIEMVRSRQLLSCPTDTPPRLYSLMMECWHEDAHKRPTAREVHQKMRAWYLDNTYAFSTTTGPSATSASSSTLPSHHSSGTGAPKPTAVKKIPDIPYYSTIDTFNTPKHPDSPTSCSMTSFDDMSEMTESTHNHLNTNGNAPSNTPYSSHPQTRFASLTKKKPDHEFNSQTEPLFETDQV